MNWSDPPLILAATNVVIALIYTIVTGLICHATWQNTSATKNVLEAAYRPYVGITNVELPYDQIGADPRLAVTIKNVGSVPSRYIEVDLEIRIAGVASSLAGWGRRDYIALLPGQSFVPSSDLSRENNPELQPGSEFTVLVQIKYKGMTDKQYTTQSTYTYAPDDSKFVISAGQFE